MPMDQGKSSDMVAAPASPEEENAAATGDSSDEEAPQNQMDNEQAPAAALKKGPWTAAEDTMLMNHVLQHGEGNWNAVQRMSGLLRCGKSCRLRWTNHLRPNLKKGSFSPQEELLIAQLHAQLGNKWARMASHLPGRTDNEIKNYWNTRCKRRQRAGLPVYPPEVQLQLATAAKRCRYDDFSGPLSSSSPQESGSSGNVLSLGLGAPDAAAGSYTSARPAALDLAMGTRPVQFLNAPTMPFSAPSTPWSTTPPFQRNARYLKLSSAPVSPTGAPPVHPVTPELSLGGLPGTARFPPLSPVPGAARVELPSSQLRPAMQQPTPAPGGQQAASATAGVPQYQQNGTSYEEILQGLNDAIKPPENGSSVDANGQQQEEADGVSEENKMATSNS
ncbi:hypothetical protein BRADI_1g15581v3 [Brachypodium distachyon]|uniref:Transcription factor GAMYB n=1 Tax=Brachypodium distachyon TaxID=15368 RepID=A0A2K2DJN5_BRADI|nr:hypothetical protein BRADI_1g15581v3 [Brachypodium distachyon]